LVLVGATSKYIPAGYAACVLQLKYYGSSHLISVKCKARGKCIQFNP
jgi:hypothetical protein